MSGARTYVHSEDISRINVIGARAEYGSGLFGYANIQKVREFSTHSHSLTSPCHFTACRVSNAAATVTLTPSIVSLHSVSRLS